MTCPKIKKAWLIVIAVIIVLALTNPSMKQFDEFTGVTDKWELKRVYDWVIFSVYEDDSQGEPVRYTAIFMNFFKRQ
jgi:hypothetical protein